ncbi:MAG: hypothetical protein HOO06_15460 [Bdellovibrionaceae bacterium]|nr:hypothetical protein [Pseudobdellovibrionaceae bacterium]
MLQSIVILLFLLIGLSGCRLDDNSIRGVMANDTDSNSPDAEPALPSTPLISLSEPDGTADAVVVSEFYNITWTDLAVEVGVDAQINLYLKSTNTGSCSLGTLIVAGLSEDADGTNGSYNWNTNLVEEGAYYICASINNGNETIESHSPGQVSLSGPCLWTGSIDNDWATAGNWINCNSTVPQVADKVVISPLGTPIVSVNATIDSFGQGVGGGVITINAGVRLEVTSDADTVFSDVQVVGGSTTCIDCELYLSSANPKIMNDATLTLLKGVQLLVQSGSHPDILLGNGTSSGHLKTNGGSNNGEWPEIKHVGGGQNWGLGGVLLEGSVGNPSSVDINGLVIHASGGNNANTSHFHFINNYTIQNMDNVQLMSVLNENRNDSFEFQNCPSATINDFTWDNINFVRYYDQSTGDRGRNVQASDCTGLAGTISFTNPKGQGFGSIYENDPNNLVNWPANETAYNCLWNGVVSNVWTNPANWSNCMKGSTVRNDYPDQYDSIAISTTAANVLRVSGDSDYQQRAINSLYYTGTPGVTAAIEIESGAHLWLNTGNIKSEVIFKGSVDNCTDCEVRSTNFTISDNATLILNRGIQLRVNTGGKVYVGDGVTPGHFLTNPASADSSFWPMVSSFYYYFDGMVVEGTGVDASSVDIDGLVFDGAIYASTNHLQFLDDYEIKSLDNTIFSTAFDSDLQGHYIDIHNCNNGTFTDTSWLGLDFAQVVKTTAPAGYNIYMNPSCAAASVALTIDSLAGGSNLGYGTVFEVDPNNLVTWTP